MQIAHTDSWYYEGNALYCMDRFDEAIKYYDKIIEANPHSKTAWAFKAHSLSKLKRYDEAFACYQKALKC